MIGGCRVAELSSIEQQSDKVKNAEGVEENVSTALRSVRVDCDGMQFFAERMQVFHDRGRVVASGNVLFISGGHRISADRMDFDTKTRTGSFFDAHGVVSLGERADRSLFGTQEPDATFWGKEVQKLGPEKYRIIDGGFTTCAQPTPRWDVASGSVTHEPRRLCAARQLRVPGQGRPAFSTCLSSTIRFKKTIERPDS